MITELLYLEDAYLRSFDATVIASTADSIALDRTAFYSGGGGQPPDEGQLNETRVTNVFKDEQGLVWHVLDAPPPATGTRIEATLGLVFAWKSTAISMSGPSDSRSTCMDFTAADIFFRVSIHS